MPKQSLKQRRDKRYRAWFQGKQFYGSTQKEARAKRDEYKQQVEAGINVAAFGTLTGSYCIQWLETYKTKVTPASKSAYRRQLMHFCDYHSGGTALGDMPIRVITASMVQEFLNSLSGKSYATIRQHATTIRAVFRSAVADRIILYDPTLRSTPPKGRKGTHRVITEKERELIHSTPHRARLAALVMLYAGLRRGEVLALDIDRDVDYNNKTIHVQQAVRFVNQHRPELADPKTEAGERYIPLLDFLAKELKDYHGLVLPSAKGELMTESAWKRCWQSYMVALSVAANGDGKRWHKGKWVEVDIRAHDLRHSYCTMLFDSGVDLKSAQAWMGHADTKVTMDIYTHLSKDRESKAIIDLENAVKKLSAVQNTVQNQSEDPKTVEQQGLQD